MKVTKSYSPQDCKAKFIEEVIKSDSGSEIRTGKIEFYAAVFGNVDKTNDIVVSKAFDETIVKDFKDVRLTLNHDEVIGVIKSMETDNYGLLVKTELPLDNQVPRETYNLAKLFDQNSQSLQYSFVADIITKSLENKVRKLETLKLKDVSILTVLGANPQTKTVAIKSIGDGQNDTEEAPEMEDSKICPSCGRKIDFTDPTTVLSDISDMIGEFAFNETRWMTMQEVEREIETLRPDINAKVREYISSIVIKADQGQIFQYTTCKTCGTKVPRGKKKQVMKSLDKVIETFEIKKSINLANYK